MEYFQGMEYFNGCYGSSGIIGVQAAARLLEVTPNDIENLVRLGLITRYAWATGAFVLSHADVHRLLQYPDAWQSWVAKQVRD